MRYPKLLVVSLLALTTACSASGEKPTEADISTALKKAWVHEGTSTRPAETVTINQITIGASDEATLSEVMDGVPKGGLVTAAKIDFIATTHYTEKKDVRRIMTAAVYKNKFNEWEVMNTGVVYP